ncbi:hypothetical protein FVE85_6886 [Porphyridium purpureum]|uniref:CCHC-type domain-containing protein n=1 Tax=Porphyridium purpureum TaxID=35688 RepID=A0A5J4Z614_PORPP|nr:hypothetical protein FVE85_6886 [Porphyridium purpureum]|eukprot:POR0467..scf295_1
MDAFVGVRTSALAVRRWRGTRAPGQTGWRGQHDRRHVCAQSRARQVSRAALVAVADDAASRVGKREVIQVTEEEKTRVGADAPGVRSAGAVSSARRTIRGRIALLPVGALCPALHAPLAGARDTSRSATRRASHVSTDRGRKPAARGVTVLAATLAQSSISSGVTEQKQRSTRQRHRAAPRAGESRRGGFAGPMRTVAPSSPRKISTAAPSAAASRLKTSRSRNAAAAPSIGASLTDLRSGVSVKQRTRRISSKRAPVARRCSRCGDFGHNSRSCPHEYFQSRLPERSFESQHCAKCNGAGVVACGVCNGTQGLSVKSNPSMGVLASPTVRLMALSHMTYNYLGEGRSEICCCCGGSSLQVCPSCHGLA